MTDSKEITGFTYRGLTHINLNLRVLSTCSPALQKGYRTAFTARHEIRKLDAMKNGAEGSSQAKQRKDTQQNKELQDEKHDRK